MYESLEVYMAFNARFCDDFYRSTKKCLFLVAEVHKEILEPTFLVGDDIFLVVSLQGNLDGNLELRNLSIIKGPLNIGPCDFMLGIDLFKFERIESSFNWVHKI
jgi:hypothetical protein